MCWKWAETVHTQDIGRVTTSQIFHVDVQSVGDNQSSMNTSLMYEDLESIFVNSHMYTIPSKATCMETYSNQMVVSNCVTTCPMDNHEVV